MFGTLCSSYRAAGRGRCFSPAKNLGKSLVSRGVDEKGQLNVSGVISVGFVLAGLNCVGALMNYDWGTESWLHSVPLGASLGVLTGAASDLGAIIHSVYAAANVRTIRVFYGP